MYFTIDGILVSMEYNNILFSFLESLRLCLEDMAIIGTCKILMTPRQLRVL